MRISPVLSSICALFLCLWLAAGARAAAPVILVLGDSISAGYGLPAQSAWPVLLQNRLRAQGYPHAVVNASISGDTTAGGRARLDALLAQHRPAITIIELGGNDGLRGSSVDAMRANLEAMSATAQKAGSHVLLVGMRMPPNYGPVYVARFDATFAEVAKSRKTALVPFFFDGFADDDAMFQGDRIHPVVGAQPKLLENVWRELKPLLGAPGKSG
jgi:acyl-CoA thioesterase I